MLITAHELSCRKVMSSFVSVSLFVGRPMMCWIPLYRPHWTWELTVQGLPALALPPMTWDLAVQRPPFPASDIGLPSLETCSDLFSSWPLPPFYIQWHLVMAIEVRAVGMLSCYHLQTKLREGNVFTGVCLFTGGLYMMSLPVWLPDLMLLEGVSVLGVCQRVSMKGCSIFMGSTSNRDHLDRDPQTETSTPSIDIL